MPYPPEIQTQQGARSAMYITRSGTRATSNEAAFVFPVNMLGFYFHIPFCPHICPYCDFTKTSQFSKKDVQAYFKGLEDMLDDILSSRGPTALPSRGLTAGSSIPKHTLIQKNCTVYFGGGTPG